MKETGRKQSRIRYRDEIKESDMNSCSILRLRASCPLHWCKQSFGHCPFQVTRPWLQKASIQEASETIRAINKQAASLGAKSGPLFPTKWSVSPGKEMAYR